MKFKYETVVVEVRSQGMHSYFDIDPVDKTLEAMGDRGWELVSVVPDGTDVILFFKKLVES